MSRNGGKPQYSREEIQGFIDGFEAQLAEAQKELDKADQDLANWKIAQIESQRQEAEANARPGTLPRAGVFFLEKSEDAKHLEYLRGRAVGKVADLQRRIKSLEKAYRMTPE